MSAVPILASCQKCGDKRLKYKFSYNSTWITLTSNCIDKRIVTEGECSFPMKELYLSDHLHGSIGISGYKVGLIHINQYL